MEKIFYDVSVAIEVDNKQYPTQSFVYESIRKELERIELMEVVDLKVEHRR